MTLKEKKMLDVIRTIIRIGATSTIPLQRRYLLMYRAARLIRDEISPKDREERNARLRKRCVHDDWYMTISNRLGHGTCVKCGGEQPMPLLLNRWKERAERELGLRK